MMGKILTRQQWRLLLRNGFFTLFVLAPPLDVLRLDLTLGHFILFGQPWTLGLQAFQQDMMSSSQAAWNLIWRGFLPLLLVVGGVIGIAWRYGRLYCGWLCPHFSVVETINQLMRCACGKPSVWERKPLPTLQPDGQVRTPNPLYWLIVGVAVLGFSFLWALVFLTYLLPPKEIYSNLLTLSFTRNQSLFLSVATLALIVEFTLARHLFCRYACAVGLFQSLAWMANKKALVVSYDRQRAKACAECNNACDNACPMRLKPRSIKRKMFTCTQCTACIGACEQVQTHQSQAPLLQWVQDAAAVAVADGQKRGVQRVVISR